MILTGFKKEDFKHLQKVIAINKKHYDHYYDNKRIQKKAKNINRIVYDKIVSLKNYLKLDKRFAGFEIGVSTPKKQAGRGKGGEYRGNL